MNLRRLNYILIPETWEARQRLGNSLVGKFVLRPIVAFYLAFTDEGHAMIFMALLAGFLSLNVQHTYGYLLWSVMASLLFAAFIVRRPFALRDVDIRLRGNDRVAVGADLRLTLEITNRGTEVVEHLRTFFGMLSWDGHYRGPRPAIDRIEPGATARLTRRVTFDARGDHYIEAPVVFAVTPLALSQSPPSRAANDLHVLVLPRVLPVTNLTDPAGGRHGSDEGVRASRSGAAYDVLGVRPYRPGDPVRDLHARTWARTGEPHVREYEDVRLAQTLIVVDCTARARDERAFEAMLVVAASMADHLMQGGGVHLVTTDSRFPEVSVRPGQDIRLAFDALAQVAMQSEPDPDAPRRVAHAAAHARVAWVLTGHGTPRIEPLLTAARTGCATAAFHVADRDTPGAAGMRRLSAADIEQAEALRL